MRKRWRCLVGLLALLLVVQSASAQDTLVMLPIFYDRDVQGELTDTQFFAHWELTASAGDRILIRMTGANGLRPLIGLLDKGGTLLARSEDGEADSTVELNFTIPADDSYRIVATRAGNEDGATTGAYTLRVDLLNPPPTRAPNFQDVTFLCGTSEATALASLHFSREPEDNGAYSLRVYGLDGLQPVIRVQSGDHNLCVTEPADAVGDVLTLPNERPLTLTDASATVQHIITSENADPQSITVTIGSAGDLAGRYLAVIGGFSLEPGTDTDDFTVRLAPRPAQGEAPLLTYVMGLNNRLDPGITSDAFECDDAGRRGCESIPSFDGAGVIFKGDIRAVGDRFDTGMQIDDADPHRLRVLSFGGTTHGDYALILIGNLSPRDGS